MPVNRPLIPRIGAEARTRLAELDSAVAKMSVERGQLERVLEALGDLQADASASAQSASAPKASSRRRRRRRGEGPSNRDRILAAIENRGGTATARAIAADTGMPIDHVQTELSKIKRVEGILANDRAARTWSRVKRPLTLAPDPASAAA